MQPLYRIILKKAWDITRKYKFLWFFGIFALWLGNGGEMQIFFKTLYAVQDLSASQIPQVLNNFLMIDFIRNAGNLQSILIWVLFIVLELVFVFIGVWLVVTSQVAIIRATDEASNGKKPMFVDSFKGSQMYFWKVLGLNIISEVIIGLFVSLFVILLLLIVVNLGSQFKFLVGVIIFVIFLPIAIIISFVMRYAINFVVLKEEKFLDSISKAWFLFKTNWLVSLEMTLALLIINSLIGLIIVYFTIIIIGPFFRMDMMSLFAFQNVAFGLIFFKLLPLFLIYMFVGAGIAVYQTVAWTLLFNELVSSKRYSKLVRIIDYFSNYIKTKNQIESSADLKKIPNIESVAVKRRSGRPKANK